MVLYILQKARVLYSVIDCPHIVTDTKRDELGISARKQNTSMIIEAPSCSWSMRLWPRRHSCCRETQPDSYHLLRPFAQMQRYWDYKEQHSCCSFPQYWLFSSGKCLQTHFQNMLLEVSIWYRVLGWKTHKHYCFGRKNRVPRHTPGCFCSQQLSIPTRLHNYHSHPHSFWRNRDHSIPRPSV